MSYINQTFLLQRVYYIFSTSVKRMKIYALTSDWLVIEMILGSKKKLKEIFWSTPDFGPTRILCIFNLNELGGKERAVGFQTLCTVKPEKSFTCHCLCIFPSHGRCLCLCVQSICSTRLCLCVQSWSLPLSLCTLKVPVFVFLYIQTAIIVAYHVPDVSSNFPFTTLKDEKLPNHHQKKILNTFNPIGSIWSNTVKCEKPSLTSMHIWCPLFTCWMRIDVASVGDLSLQDIPFWTNFGSKKKDILYLKGAYFYA